VAKQRAALPPNATLLQKKMANLVPIRKGERLPGSGHPTLARSFPDVMRAMLEGSSLDIRISYPNGRPDKHIKLDSSESFKSAIVASMISQATHGSLKAAELLMDRTEGKAVVKIADVSQRPFVITGLEAVEAITDGEVPYNDGSTTDGKEEGEEQ
jgi:hypothetical protein